MYCTVKEIIRDVLDTDVPDSECVFAVVLTRGDVRHIPEGTKGRSPQNVKTAAPETQKMMGAENINRRRHIMAVRGINKVILVGVRR